MHRKIRSRRTERRPDTERTRRFPVHPRPEPAEAGDVTLIFVGALTPQKRPDLFIEVVGRLRASGRPFCAIMVGDGPLARTLDPLAATHGVELLGPRSMCPNSSARRTCSCSPVCPRARVCQAY